MDMSTVLEKINFKEIAARVKAKNSGGGGAKSGLDKLSRVGGVGTSLKSQTGKS